MAYVGMQINLNNLSHDLEQLGQLLGYPPQGNHSVWKCPLGRENDGSAKAKMFVTKEDFLMTLANHPDLVQRLCTVYIQDILCMGFPLPRECEDGRELAWIDAPAS